MKIDSVGTAQTFGNRSEAVVQRFLQSAVVFDDLAWMGLESLSEIDVGAEPLIEPSIGEDSSPDGRSNVHGASPEPIQRVDQRGVPLDAKPLIDGFASLGVACAVLRPSQNEIASSEWTRSGVVEAAKRADIIVLDWRLGPSYGTDTLEIVRNILAEDSRHNRLRLIAIYTGENDLRDITKQVRDTIDEFYGNSWQVVEGKFWVSKGPVRATVIPKEGNSFPDAIGIHESALPGQLVKEFATITQGMLRNVALAGISALRDSTHSVLAKFGPELDPAYLGHRMLLDDPSEAEDHIVEALGAELLSILEDQRPGNEASVGAIENWLVERISDGRIAQGTLKSVSGIIDPLAMRMELVGKGIGHVSDPDPSKGQLERNATALFAEDVQSAKRADLAFAALLSLKTRYPTVQPALTLGTVLRKGPLGAGSQYLLCIQPKCDSVRLRSATGFPLIPLRVTQDNQPFAIVIENPNHEWVTLDVDTKPSRLVFASFAPQDPKKGEIVASKRAFDYFFSDTTGTEYQWLGELKDEHAMQFAGEVAANLGRPGPNYSEWLRRARRRRR